MVDRDFDEDIKNCVAVLEAGGVILYPTDTIWGLGCDATNADAVDRVFAIKQRPADKTMIVLLADARQVIQYVATPPPDIIAMIGEFPRPTTVIYDNAIGLADNVIREDGTAAIRVATDDFCKALIKRFRKPIVSTSANLSGQPPAAIFSEVAPEILAAVDYTVHHHRGDIVKQPPSRLVRIADNGEMTVLRG